MLRHPVPHQGTNCIHTQSQRIKQAASSHKTGTRERWLRPALLTGSCSQHGTGASALSAAADHAREASLASVREGPVAQRTPSPDQQQQHHHQEEHPCSSSSNSAPSTAPSQPHHPIHLTDAAAWISATPLGLNAHQAGKLARHAQQRAADLPDSWRALQALAEPAGVDPADLVRADTLLLALPADRLLANAASNAAALRCSPPTLVQAARRHSAVLRLPPGELQSRLEGLSSLLDMPLPTLQRLAVQHPLLLGRPPAAVRARLSHLQAALELPFSQLVEVVITNPAALAHSPRHLDALVAAATRHMSPQQLALAVRRDPWVLNLAPRTLPQRLAHLQRFLGVPPEAAVSMVVRRPALLRRAPETLQRAFDTLRFLACYPRAYLVEAVKAHPLLLRLSPATLRGRCLFLRDLLRRSPWYRHQAARLPAHLLGVLLMHLDQAADALSFLADARQEAALSLVDALQRPRLAAVAARFPLMAAWLQWRAAGGKRHARYMLRLHLGMYDAAPEAASTGSQQVAEGQPAGSTTGMATSSTTTAAATPTTTTTATASTSRTKAPAQDAASRLQEASSSSSSMLEDRASSHARASTSAPSSWPPSTTPTPYPAPSANPTPAAVCGTIANTTAAAAGPLLDALDDVCPPPLSAPPPPDPTLPPPTQPPRFQPLRFQSPRHRNHQQPQQQQPQQQQRQERGPPLVRPRPRQQPAELQQPRSAFSLQPPPGPSSSTASEPIPLLAPRPSNLQHQQPAGRNRTPPRSLLLPADAQDLSPTPSSGPTPASTPQSAVTTGRSSSDSGSTPAASTPAAPVPGPQPSPSASASSSSSSSTTTTSSHPVAPPGVRWKGQQHHHTPAASAVACDAAVAASTLRGGKGGAGLPCLSPPPLLLQPLEELQVATASASSGSSGSGGLEAYQLQGGTIVLPPQGEHAVGPCHSSTPCAHLMAAAGAVEGEGAAGTAGPGCCSQPQGLGHRGGLGLRDGSGSGNDEAAAGLRPQQLGLGQCLPQPPVLQHGLASPVGLLSGSSGGSTAAGVGHAAVVLQSS